MLKQRLTLNQSPTQSGRTRHQKRDVVTGASDDRALCGKLPHTVLSSVSPEG